VLNRILAALMTAQAVLGLILPAQYRDAEWIKATWWGNDWVTLALASPLLWIAARRARLGSIRGQLLCVGMLGYAVYNYAFYLFGAALNVFLPLYVVTVSLAIVTLAAALNRIDANQVANRFQRGTPVRLVGAYLIVVAGGLTVVWLSLWAAYVFAARPTPVEPEVFKIVAALDFVWLVPSLATGGALLWSRRPWGFVIASAASVQASLYLLVLSVNSFVAVERGLTTSPGELPLWGTLTVLTGVAALILFANCSEADSAVAT
jgi:hypothetical protein